MGEHGSGMKLLTVNFLGGFKGGIEKFVYMTAGLLSQDGHKLYGLFERRFDEDPLFVSAFDEIYTINGGKPNDIIEEIRAAGVTTALVHKVCSVELLEKLQASFRTILFVHDHDYYCMRHHKYLPLFHFNCHLPFSLLGCTLCSGMLEHGKSASSLNCFNPLKRYRLFHAVRRCDRFVVLSEFMRGNLIQNGFPAEKIVKIVPPAITTPEPLPFSGARNLLFAGPLLKGKGVALLLRALTHVKSSFTLRIVGSGSDKSRLIRLTLEMDLAEKVEFMDYVDDLSMEYRRTDLVLVPSRWQEPFGLIGIEAFCHARPVIAFVNGGIGEWLRDGNNGLAVEPNNIKDLATKIDYLLAHPEEAETMGRNGWEMVRREYTPERFVNALNQLIGELNA